MGKYLPASNMGGIVGSRSRIQSAIMSACTPGEHACHSLSPTPSASRVDCLFRKASTCEKS